MVTRAAQEIFARRMVDSSTLVDRLLDLVGSIPTPREGPHPQPEQRARALARRAAVKAASAAGTLALPPGPLGWLTIAPELYAVWRIQAQLVADVAGVYGKPELLSREQMLYCLFGHTAASSVSELVIRVGERYVVRRQPLAALYAIGNKVALRMVQRSASRVASRWVPALGALGVAGFVYVDTGHVATASIALFSADVLIEAAAPAESAPEEGSAAPATAKRPRPRAASKNPGRKSARPSVNADADAVAATSSQQRRAQGRAAATSSSKATGKSTEAKASKRGAAKPKQKPRPE